MSQVGSFKPQMVLLNIGWSEGGICYELYTWEEGFYELTWFDTPNCVYDAWFHSYDAALAVYNAVVYYEEWNKACQSTDEM